MGKRGEDGLMSNWRIFISSLNLIMNNGEWFNLINVDDDTC